MVTAFTLLIVAVLAIGIGGTTSIFSIVNGVVLQPLPFRDADRLVAIQSATRGDEDGTASVPDVNDFQAARTVRVSPACARRSWPSSWGRRIWSAAPPAWTRRRL